MASSRNSSSNSPRLMVGLARGRGPPGARTSVCPRAKLLLLCAARADLSWACSANCSRHHLLSSSASGIGASISCRICSHGASLCARACPNDEEELAAEARRGGAGPRGRLESRCTECLPTDVVAALASLPVARDRVRQILSWLGPAWTLRLLVPPQDADQVTIQGEVIVVEEPHPGQPHVDQRGGPTDPLVEADNLGLHNPAKSGYAHRGRQMPPTPSGRGPRRVDHEMARDAAGSGRLEVQGRAEGLVIARGGALFRAPVHEPLRGIPDVSPDLTAGLSDRCRRARDPGQLAVLARRARGRDLRGGRRLVLLQLRTSSG